MARPTLTEQQAEVEALKKMKPKVRHRTASGDDNRAAIEAQIEVIEKRMTDDQIYDKLDEEEWNETLVDSANDARNWLTGDEPEPPSKGWAELVE